VNILLHQEPQPIQRSILTPFVYPSSLLPPTASTIIVEVGPGRGDFLFHLAENSPSATVVGIEIKRKRVDKLIARIERRCLANVGIIQDDARAALPRFFPEGTVDEIHINFPDPWPKRRHAKHRAMGAAFIADCLRALRVGGTISFTTDHRPYAEGVAAAFSEFPAFASCYEAPIITHLPEAYPTFFAMKWRAEGREITYQKYRKGVIGDS
jgi:tRNA (guanine-N7-)-methyltransferase